ncbi:PHP domain-containing protein [Nocardioides lentus]|uniref:PHP domain-containing protein n=1 Tax=Nocardioides lentus TaxID=338077 RepID=A0ABP5AXR8_9ACTN
MSTEPRIDLHTHSSVSDGTQTPTELVRAAAAAGIDVLGLTDHDTARGWDEAGRAAAEAGVALVRGMEISTRYGGPGGPGVHLLAYLLDPTHPGLDAELDRVLGGRGGRVPAMVEALRGLGIRITVADVEAQATDSVATGRPHVADALVALGVVGHRDQAFAEYLQEGRPAYVGRHAADLRTMVGLVADAGGVAVVAHPWGRVDPARLDGAALAGLRDAGLTGLEVDHQDHTDAQRRELRAIAADLDLVVTGSSDHHGTGKTDHDLGCHTTAPAELDRLLGRAAAAAAASGRAVPPGPGSRPV